MLQNGEISYVKSANVLHPGSGPPATVAPWPNKTTPTACPHDPAFKAICSHPRMIADALRGYAVKPNDSAQAWLYGKLLLALLAEKLARHAEARAVSQRSRTPSHLLRHIGPFRGRYPCKLSIYA